MRSIHFKPRRFPGDDIWTLFRLRQRSKQRGQQAVARENTQLELTVINQRLRAELLSAACLVAGAGLVGLWSFQNADYGDLPWWRVMADEDAARSLRAWAAPTDAT